MYMKKAFLIFTCSLTLLSCSVKKEITSNYIPSNTNIAYNDYFTENTMRFDFHHSGNSKDEMYHFDRVIREGIWAGSRVSLINPFNYGEQMFRIVDSATGNVIYKNNYCTLFNEWQTTPEASSCPTRAKTRRQQAASPLPPSYQARTAQAARFQRSRTQSPIQGAKMQARQVAAIRFSK